MRQVKRQRYPRIACSVPTCGRGTTTCEPGTRIICGKCWRKAPKEMRAEYGQWRRRLTAAEKRGDPRANAYAFKVGRAWETILRLLTAPPEENDAIPALMREQLRKEGLLDA